jgi:hypothetical protein
MDNGRHEDLKGQRQMRVLENNYGWNPIETAPLDEDVSLEVADGRGARYRIQPQDHPMTSRRFPAPWRADKIPGGYVVRDANGQALTYIYSFSW